MNVFELSAQLKLDTSQYEQGLNKAKSSMEGFDRTNSQKSSNVSQAWNIAAVAIGNIISNVFSKVTSTISNAVDGAISRVDILNNYSIVMEGLGYSATDAKNAVSELSDGIQGLPTTLPGIVTVQKQFVPLLGSLDKATDLTLALNNAVTAGGQGQEVANSALNQWYQMIANGMPDLQSWRIINQAMPAQLDQIAKSLFGVDATTQDLFEAWAGKDGARFQVTTQEVMDMMIKLSKEGGDGFASFEKQAHNASKGIATSMQNVKTAVVTQLANVTQAAMDNGLDISGMFDTLKQGIRDLGGSIVDSMGKAKFGQLSNRIKDLIKMIFDALKKIDWEKLITTTLNAITKLVTFVTKHFKGILTLVKGIAAAFIGWKIGGIVNNIVKGVGSMIGLFKNLVGAIRGVEGAQKALNTAMSANPFGIILTAVTTLMAVLPDVVGWFKEWLGITGWSDIKEQMEEVCDAAKRNRDAAEDMFETIKGGADSSSAEAAKMQGLVDMLNECVDSNGALKEGMEERANYALNELNNALGTEYTMEQLLNEGWENMRENILGVIEAQRYQSLMNTYWEQWEDAQANMGDTMKDLITSYQDLNAMTDVYNQTMEGASKAAFADLTDEMLKSELGLDDLETAYNDNSVAFSRMIEEQSVAEAARMAEADGNYTRAAEILDTYAKTRQLTAEAQTIAAKKASEAEILALEQMLTEMGYSADEVKTLMSNITTDMDLSAKMAEIGQNGASSFGTSFTNTWNSNKGGIFGLVDDLTYGIRHKLGIASPSKVFKSIGKFTSQGFGEGFDKEFKNTKKTFMDDMDSLVDYSNDLSFGEIGVSQSAKRQQNEVNSLKSAINGLQQSIAQLTSSDRMLNATIKIGDTTLAKTISRTLTNQQYREVAT